MKFLYMKVSKDKYELPVAVAESVDELARMTGNTKKSIYSMVSRNTGGYRKVEVMEDEDGERKKKKGWSRKKQRKTI